MSPARYTPDELKAALAGGLIPAVPVMFDRENRFHESAHESYLSYMSSQPIAGVAVWAHTGRGLLLDDYMARRIMQEWRRVLRDRPLIAGVGPRSNELNAAHSLSSTLEMASTAAECGADALLVYPPSWLKDHEQKDSLIIEHHERLSAIGLPLILFYLYEAAGGIRYTPRVLDELLALPNVIGIKMATLDSVMTYQDIARHIQSRHPEKMIITGEDRFLGYSLRRGAQAALIGLGAVCCDPQAELLRAHFAGDAQRFLELSDMIDRLAEVIFVDPMEGYIGRILYVLSNVGVIPQDAANDPWGPSLTANEIDNITTLLNTLTVQAEKCSPF
ncbi:MAG TPA: dihydrodipicolinate synthase family protein [Pyrinomonadaceae bacterium]|jgi:Dihydrodipicolinate synthase/N-acetylneuraminate lyase|nr:dihydrodipicolinate synthase family protein [Pyrinomonadaceae bacterium]